MHEILSSTFAHCDILKRIDFINLYLLQFLFPKVTTIFLSNNLWTDLVFRKRTLWKLVLERKLLYRVGTKTCFYYLLWVRQEMSNGWNKKIKLLLLKYQICMYVGGKLLSNKTPDKTTSRGEPKLVLCYLVPKNECFALMLVDSLIRFGWAQSMEAIEIHWPGLCQ